MSWVGPGSRPVRRRLMSLSDNGHVAMLALKTRLGDDGEFAEWVGSHPSSPAVGPCRGWPPPLVAGRRSSPCWWTSTPRRQLWSGFVSHRCAPVQNSSVCTFSLPSQPALFASDPGHLTLSETASPQCLTQGEPPKGKGLASPLRRGCRWWEALSP